MGTEDYRRSLTLKGELSESLGEMRSVNEMFLVGVG